MANLKKMPKELLEVVVQDILDGGNGKSEKCIRVGVLCEVKEWTERNKTNGAIYADWAAGFHLSADDPSRPDAKVEGKVLWYDSLQSKLDEMIAKEI